MRTHKTLKSFQGPHRLERANFFNWLINNPWMVSWCLWQLGWVGFCGVGNKLRRGCTKDVHKRGKKRIKINASWKTPYLVKHKGEIQFPYYPEISATSVNFKFHSTKKTEGYGDVESEFARHRWGCCQHALFGSNVEIKSAVQVAVDWMRDPPPRSDPAWEPYSASERLANLAVLLAARPQARRHISEETLRTFFSETLTWIAGHLEYYGKNRTNNHILNNARALTIGGIVTQQVSFVKYGLELFSEMSQRIFLSGGYLRERSTHYQVITNNWVLDTLWFGSLAKKHSNKISQRIEEIKNLAKTVSSATSNMVALLKSCDSQIGDISPDCAPEISIKRIMKLYPGYSRQIYFGNQSVNQDGWVLLSNMGSKIISNFTPGRFPEKFPTHGHNDLGHFIWISGGSCILADPGRCRYNSNSRWISQTQSKSHNLLQINGMGPLDESVAKNRKIHFSPYSIAAIKADVTSNTFSLKHDGFKRIRGVGCYHREVKLFNRRIEIKDQVQGTGLVTIESMLHFDSSFSPRDKNKLSVQSDSRKIEISFFPRNNSLPEISWEQYDFTSFYGEARSAYRMITRWRVQLPFQTTIILLDLGK